MYPRVRDLSGARRGRCARLSRPRHSGTGEPVRRTTALLALGALLGMTSGTACLRPGRPDAPGPRSNLTIVRGAVASAEPIATETGLSILRNGGNAADAAVAVALALAVVHPQAGNLGGGGFAVVRAGGTGDALDLRSTTTASQPAA